MFFKKRSGFQDPKMLVGLLYFLACWFPVIGQVQNDNIEHRRVLKTEEIAFSNTNLCTVQRSCVDESLTGKCVEYHNDQWFEFTPETSGDYFVNISGQQCRDTRGVQVVVLNGIPCEPKTYKVLSCNSFGSQDDIFVALINLQAKQTYLLNVDGYLNDQCQFQIAVSKKPKGLPATQIPGSSSGKPVENKIVAMNWVLPDSVFAGSFRIFRREINQFKAVELARLPTQRDTYGNLKPDYVYTDTLPQTGKYLYTILAEGNKEEEAPVLLQQQWYSWQSFANTPLYYKLPLEKYPNGSSLSIIITDAGTGKLLLNTQIKKQKNPQNGGNLRINEWQQQGIRRIRVEIGQRKKGKVPEVTSFLVNLPVGNPQF